jgi:hypothetical protein
VSPKSLSPVSTGTPTKPLSPKPPSTSTSTMKPSPPKSVSPKPPAPVTATKPGLPPRTTPAPPRIAPLKSSQSLPQPTVLPYTPSQLHRTVLPKFIYPTPESSCNSVGLSTFNRLFPQPLWELEQASLFILEKLYPSDDTYTFTPKRLDGAVSLVMRDMDGNAHAENSTVIVSSGGRKQFKWRSDLVFSTRNLTNLANRNAGDTWFIEEVRGVIVHELTHSWQWSCNNVPGGLIEGPPSPTFLKWTKFPRDCRFCETSSGSGTIPLAPFTKGQEMGSRIRNNSLLPRLHRQRHLSWLRSLCE